MTTKFIGSGYPSESNKYYTQTEVDTLVAGVSTSSHTHTNYQPINSNLTALSGLTGAADRLAYFTGAGTLSLTTLTSTARTLLGNSDAAAMRSTLGLVIGTNVQSYNSNLAAIAGLTSAADRLAYFTGSGTASLATFTSAGRTFVGLTDTAAMRSNLGLVIGTNVQAYSSTLDKLGAITVANNTLVYFNSLGNGGTTPITTFGQDLVSSAAAANARATLGLQIGINVQAYNSNLAALSTPTPVANAIPYYTSATASGLISANSFTRSILEAPNESGVRTLINAQTASAGLSSIAGQSSTTSLGFLKKTATDIFQLAPSLVSEISSENATLGAIAALNNGTTTGYLKRTATNTYSVVSSASLDYVSNNSIAYLQYINERPAVRGTQGSGFSSETNYYQTNGGAGNWSTVFKNASTNANSGNIGFNLPASAYPTGYVGRVFVSLSAMCDTDPYVLYDLGFYVDFNNYHGAGTAYLSPSNIEMLRFGTQSANRYGITYIIAAPDDVALYFTLAGKVNLSGGGTTASRGRIYNVSATVWRTGG